MRSRLFLSLVISLLAFSLQPSLLAAPTPMIADVETVDGSDGGELRAGMWTVQVPPGAYGGSAVVTMATPLATPRLCQLDIAPLDKNSFSRPVILTVTLPKDEISLSMRIQWFDPATQSWRVVPGSRVNLSQGTVSAPLTHFSLYEVTDGKNGW